MSRLWLVSLLPLACAEPSPVSRVDAGAPPAPDGAEASPPEACPLAAVLVERWDAEHGWQRSGDATTSASAHALTLTAKPAADAGAVLPTQAFSGAYRLTVEATLDELLDGGQIVLGLSDGVGADSTGTSVVIEGHASSSPVARLRVGDVVSEPISVPVGVRLAFVVTQTGSGVALAVASAGVEVEVASALPCQAIQLGARGGVARATVGTLTLERCDVPGPACAPGGCGPAPDACSRTYCNPAAGCGVVGPEVVCDDGLACTLDACVEGACTHGPQDAVCDVGGPCSGAAVCDPAAGCVTLQGACCQSAVDCDDGDRCDGIETCDVSKHACLAGVPLACDDGEPCNGQESCDAASGCTFAPPLVCNDGDVCNGVEYCEQWVGCVAIPPPDCDDQNLCTLEWCDASLGCVSGGATPCDDGTVCDGIETCTAGLGCAPGVPLGCDDGKPCNGQESCDALSGCVLGVPPAGCCKGPSDCEDGNLCNGIGACDAGTGTCSVTSPPVCNDGNACNGVEPCLPATGCAAGVAPACADANVCNGLEQCLPDLGCVAGAPLDCSSENLCTGAHWCDPSLGCLATPPPVCSDGDVCDGVESCDPAAGCMHGVPLGCDDGLVCNGVETCDAQAGCATGAPPLGCCTNDVHCDDSNPCNGGWTCDTGSGQCQAVVAPLMCPPTGSLCAGVSYCHPANGCQAAGALLCDDGDACNGAETCSPAFGCLSGAPLACDDGNPCTTESCSAALGCVSAPAVGPCDDGDACTKGDACTGGECHGSAFTCKTTLTCLPSTCNGAGGCTTAPLPGWCVIDGACVADGAMEAATGCSRCDVEASTSAWTPLDATPCAGSGDPSVKAWACVEGTCAIGTCIAGFFDTDGKPETGCEVVEQPGDDLWVDASYAGTVENGSYDLPFRKIQSAVAAAEPGGKTIHVRPGVYVEHVDLPWPNLTVVGQVPGQAAVVSPNDGGSFGFHVRRDGVTIQDVAIAEARYGVLAYSATETVEKTTLIGLAISGVGAHAGPGEDVAAVRATLTDGLTVTGCTMSSVVVADGAVPGPVAGLSIDASTACALTGNTIEGVVGGDGTAAGSEGGDATGIALDAVQGCVVSGNAIGPVQAGYGTKPARDGLSTGIRLAAASAKNTVTSNVIGPVSSDSQRQGVGVFLSSDSMANTLFTLGASHAPSALNTLDGEPIVYLYGAAGTALEPVVVEGLSLSGAASPTNWGKVCVLASTNIALRALDVANVTGDPGGVGQRGGNAVGIVLAGCTACSLTDSSVRGVTGGPAGLSAASDPEGGSGVGVWVAGPPVQDLSHLRISAIVGGPAATAAKGGSSAGVIVGPVFGLPVNPGAGSQTFSHLTIHQIGTVGAKSSAGVRLLGISAQQVTVRESLFSAIEGIGLTNDTAKTTSFYGELCGFFECAQGSALSVSLPSPLELGDPGFVDADGGNLRLLDSSPYIDKGATIDATSCVEPAPNGCKADLGAYGGTALATPRAGLKETDPDGHCGCP